MLALVVSDLLMRHLPDSAEGDLTRARAALVSEGGLARAAGTLDLGRFLFVGRGEERTGGRARPSILADALEALMGAVYLDGGLDAVAAVVARLFQPELADVESHAQLDYKSRLQERAQALWQAAPVYQVVAESGPDHDKRFEVALSFAGRRMGPRQRALEEGGGAERGGGGARDDRARAAFRLRPRPQKRPTMSPCRRYRRSPCAPRSPPTCWRSAGGCATPATRRTWSAAASATC